MNSEFERMKSLLEGTGLTFETGGVSYAELCAYAKGIELVRDKIEEAENIIFIGRREAEHLKRYADMLRLDGDRLGEEELISEIIRRMSLKFGQLGWGDFASEFSLIGSGQYDFYIPDVIFSNVRLDDLKQLGKLIEAYIPFFYNTYYSGSGIPFNKWDSIGYTFNRYDALNLPFDIIDNLRSEDIE